MQKMLKALKGKGAALSAVATTALVSAPAFASGGTTTVDVGAVVSAINAALGPIGQIGVAVLSVLVGIKVYKWVRRAM